MAEMQQQISQLKELMMNQRDNQSKELSKNMKFQEIILYENKKLARQVLILNQALYEERNERLKAQSMTRLNKRDHTIIETNSQIVLDLRLKCEKAQGRVSDLECENARIIEDFIHSTNDKEAKVRDYQIQNT